MNRNSIAKRFWDKVTKAEPDACWEWIGGKSYGYGVFWYEGRLRGAHQVSYLLHNSWWPEGLVMHSCDNPGCVNPKHLSQGTRADNAQDASRKGRLASGDRNGATKLNSVNVATIRELHKAGFSSKEIARTFGVTRHTICNITSGRTRRGG